LLPLTDASATFKQPARYDDLVEIRTTIREVTPLRLHFGYEVIRVEDGQLLVTGVTKHVFTDRGLKPLRLSRLMPDVY
ncbi:hypothetical protein MXD63_46495, partial [Frankia sp. Cpl3]|nr:hypothetical protein [Frankia sp. Cpl3]